MCSGCALHDRGIDLNRLPARMSFPSVVSLVRPVVSFFLSGSCRNLSAVAILQLIQQPMHFRFLQKTAKETNVGVAFETLRYLRFLLFDLKSSWPTFQKFLRTSHHTFRRRKRKAVFVDSTLNIVWANPCLPRRSLGEGGSSLVLSLSSRNVRNSAYQTFLKIFGNFTPQFPDSVMRPLMCPLRRVKNNY
jgi:hypothetical protein